MKTGSGEKNIPAPLTGKQFWKKEKLKEILSGLKKNVLNKSRKAAGFFSAKPSELSKSTSCPTAIDVGANSIKFLQLDNGAAGAAIKKIGISRFAIRADSSAAALKNLLSSLINENKIQGKVSLSLPLSELQVFSFMFPNMPEKEIKQAVIWKLKQNLPAGSDIASVSFDYNWTVFSRDNLNKEILALVFAVSKEKALRRIGLFREFSLEVAAAEPEPYAVFCALNFFKKISPQQTIVILALGENESSITIAHSGFACLIRPLSISGNSLTEAVANYHKFDLQKAESIIKSEGLKIQNAADSICMPALSSQIEGLVVDLEHTFKFFSHQLMKSQVAAYTQVILCGGAAALKNLDKCLAEKLSVPVEVFNPLEGPVFTPASPLSPEVKENAHSFAAAAGMAARYL